MTPAKRLITGHEVDSLPNWRENAIETTEKSRKKSFRRDHRSVRQYIYVDAPFRVALTEAAKLRNISIAGYLRRSVAKQIAKDLGIDWKDILVFTGRPMKFGTSTLEKGESPHMRDDGEGYGDWDN